MERRGEEKGRARRHPLSLFLSKNQLGLLSYFHFPPSPWFFLAACGGAALCGVVQQG